MGDGVARVDVRGVHRKEEEKENNSNLYQEYLKMKQKETEMLKTIPPNLKPYYKNKVNEYFKNMDGI